MSFKVLDPNLKPFVVSKAKDYKIVVFSDAHIGGITAYMPSGCLDERGAPVGQTSLQKIMESNFLSELKKLGQIDVIIFLGDMIDGRNRSSFGIDLGNVNIDIQVEWATKFIRYIMGILAPSIVLGLTGSDYHIENNADRRIIHQISLLYPEIACYFGHPSLKFELGDKLWFLNHTCSGGASKAGTLERYWKTMCVESFNRERVPDVVGYGHIHRAQNPTQIKNGENPVYGFVAPCMKVPDTFCSKGPTGTYWEIGFMKMEQKGVRLTGEYINTLEYWKIDQ